MLVIRRRAGEGFLIGDTIEVDILEIDGNQVKIGIRAPRETAILRREIAATRDTNLDSAQTVEDKALEQASKRLRLTPPSKTGLSPRL
ncbi:MAG: carbon storage regulator [Acidobacteria bacterium]|nr:carbon storage regulator [Acidobacteriota bacterium]